MFKAHRRLRCLWVANSEVCDAFFMPTDERFNLVVTRIVGNLCCALLIADGATRAAGAASTAAARR